MYKNKAKQREAVRKAVAKHRGITPSPLTGEGFTGVGITSGITDIPPIINALLDSKKRGMLEFVSQEIQRKGLPGENLFYGVNGFDFTEIPELLRITANLV